jgi:hypothetical protein
MLTDVSDSALADEQFTARFHDGFDELDAQFSGPDNAA